MRSAIFVIFSSFMLMLPSLAVLAAAEDNNSFNQLSCAQLYKMASRLESDTQRYRSPIFNEKTDLIATAIGTVTTVGYYYFGFSAVREYLEDYRVDQYRRQLDEVRYHMAQQYCFQKF